MNQEKTVLHKGKQILYDLGKAFFIGAAAGVLAALLLFVIGFFTGGISLMNGLEVAKDGMFLFGAIGLFLLAGMILVKGKKPEKFMKENGWQKHFKIIGIKSVMGMFCVGILLIAAIADYLMLILS
jgi:hypothetical protein